MQQNLILIIFVQQVATFGDLQIDEKLHIPKIKSTKYLDIIIYKHFEWDMHVTYLARKLGGILIKSRYIKKA